jgi:hypothetical protein
MANNSSIALNGAYIGRQMLLCFWIYNNAKQHHVTCLSEMTKWTRMQTTTTPTFYIPLDENSKAQDYCYAPFHLMP